MIVAMLHCAVVACVRRALWLSNDESHVSQLLVCDTDRIFGAKRVRDYKVIFSFILSKICRSEISFCVHNIRLVQHCYRWQNRPEAPE